MCQRHESRAPRRALCTVTAIAAASALMLSSCGGGDDDEERHEISLAVLSSPSPEWVSGGDALLKVGGDIPAGSTVRVTLNGNDVSTAFAVDPADGKPVGVVSGMAVGRNTIRAELLLAGQATAHSSSTLEVT